MSNVDFAAVSTREPRRETASWFLHAPCTARRERHPAPALTRTARGSDKSIGYSRLRLKILTTQPYVRRDAAIRANGRGASNGTSLHRTNDSRQTHMDRRQLAAPASSQQEQHPSIKLYLHPILVPASSKLHPSITSMEMDARHDQNPNELYTAV